MFKVLGAPLQDVERSDRHFQESDDDARKGGTSDKIALVVDGA